MAPKKNRVSIFGKTFHVTPGGQILPLGNKNNWFTKCINKSLKGTMATGTDLAPAEIKSNKDKFKNAVNSCKALNPNK